MKLENKEHFLKSEILKSPHLIAFKFSIFFILFYCLFIFIELPQIISLYLSIISLIFIPFLYYKKFKTFLFSSILVLCVSTSYFRFTDNQININKQFKDIEVLIEGKVKNVISSNHNKIVVLANCNISSKDFKAFNSIVKIDIFNTDLLQLTEGEKFNCKAKISSLTNKVFPTEFPTKQNLNSFKVNFTAKTSAKDFAIYNDASILNKTLNKIQRNFKNNIFFLFPSDVADIIYAITIGDKSFISKEEKQIYSLTGTSHIMAVSGLHVGIIAVFIYFFTFFIKEYKYRLPINSLLLIGYVILTGGQPSSIRAVGLAILVYFAIILKKHYDIRNLLGFAVIVFILIQPEIILSISFQFSVAAFLGIILFTNKISDPIIINLKISNNLAKYIIILFSTSLSAVIFTSPLVAYYFNNFTLLGIISNLYAIPLISLSLILSFLILLISFISYDLSFLLANSVTMLIRLLEGLNSKLINLNYLYFTGETALLISLIFSIILLIIINHKSILKSVSYLIFVGLFIFVFYTYNNKQTYYKDNYYYKVKLIRKNDLLDLYIYDLNKNTTIYLDMGLVNYITQQKDKVRITYNGDNGRYLFDKLKNKITLDTLIYEKENIKNYF
jgi:competence protein ComEC